jgi:hypothetical protein
MSNSSQHLDQAGDALERAWRNDLRRSRMTRPLRGRRRLVLTLVAAAAVLGAGAAIAAGVLKTVADEERGILDGHTLFEGSHPECAAITAVSFRCTLDKPPIGMAFHENPPGQTKFDEASSKRVYDKFLGAKMQTVDSTRHIDGGCIAVAADGRTWDCYLGQEAVRRDIIGPDLLGAYQPQPAAG